MHEDNKKVASLARIDLNLFRVFATIYKEKNLTRASEQLFLSQPAVSHALARLREHFNDPLFIRDGHGVMPSILAKRIWPNIEQSLSLMNEAIKSTLDFQPESDLKKLTIAMIDEFEPILLPLITQHFSKFNKGLIINSVRIDRKNLRQELVSGRIDFSIDVNHLVEEGVAQQTCLKDKLVIMCHKEHPILESGISIESYLNAEHITVSARPTGRVFEDFILSKHGFKREIKLRCQQYQTAISMLAQTEYLLTISNTQALYHKKNYPDVNIYSIPAKIEGYEMNLYWDEEKTKEQEIVWCKTQLIEIMNTLQQQFKNN